MPANTDITGDTLVAGRRLADYTPLTSGNVHTHSHSLHAIVGYAVRETMRGGRLVLPDGATTMPADPRTRVGRDVAVVEGAINYFDTFEVRDRYRSQRGGWAVVDHLYSCGCRS